MSVEQLSKEEQERLDGAKQILAKVNIQTQPKILIELNRLARSEEVSFDVVSDLVSKDVGLSAKLLKLAASPMYSRGQKFDSVHSALMAIGFQEFRTCFTSVTLSDFMGKVGYPYKGFWDHSRRVAVLCRELASKVSKRYAQNAYTLGLFHDVGAILIPLYNRAYIEHIHRALPLYFGITDLEFKMVKTNHCAVGELFGKSWGLTDDTMTALRYHHRTEMNPAWTEGARTLKSILQLAELINDKLTNKSDELLPFEDSKKTFEHIEKVLGLNEADVSHLEPELKIALNENSGV